MSDPDDPNVLSSVRAAHGRLDAYFESTREALGGDEAKMACAQLALALETHFAQEESLYFPTLFSLRPEIEQPLRRLVAEHAGFLARLDEIARHVDVGAVDEACAGFERLQRQFAHHEAGEEKILRSLA